MTRKEGDVLALVNLVYGREVPGELVGVSKVDAGEPGSLRTLRSGALKNMAELCRLLTGEMATFRLYLSALGYSSREGEGRETVPSQYRGKREEASSTELAILQAWTAEHFTVQSANSERFRCARQARLSESSRVPTPPFEPS